MKSPIVSVLIPVYNQAPYVGEALRSVFRQTFVDWEVIVIDDGSTDSTAQVIREVGGARVRYLYQNNRGVSEARNLGIQNSIGKYIALLDADDVYHPKKLEAQVASLDDNEEVGLNFVGHFIIDAGGRPFQLHRPPAEIGFRELFLEFPFTPSDLLIRREWVKKVGGFDSSIVVNEDRDFLLRLAFAGCPFARIDRFLSFRRLYAGRSYADPAKRLRDKLRVLDKAYNDDRCPAEVDALRPHAYSKAYLSAAYQAWWNEESFLAKECCRKALRIDLSENRLKTVRDALMVYTTMDGGDHELVLRKVFRQLPEELKLLHRWLDWMIGQGFLIRGVNEFLWNRPGTGSECFARASVYGAKLDRKFFKFFAGEVENYQHAFGCQATERLLERLVPEIERLGGNSAADRVANILSHPVSG